VRTLRRSRPTADLQWVASMIWSQADGVRAILCEVRGGAFRGSTLGETAPTKLPLPRGSRGCFGSGRHINAVAIMLPCFPVFIGFYTDL
jgi:hypothetical protein